MSSKGESSFAGKQPFVYMVGGVEITFPHKAYPSQLSMMDKIIRSLARKENCLLESPTGSGKSLALLCSVLAWRRKVDKEYLLLTAELETQIRNLNELPQVIPPNEEDCDDSPRQNFPKQVESTPKNHQISNIDINSFSHGNKVKYAPFQHPAFIDDDDDFKPMARGRSPSTRTSDDNINGSLSVSRERSLSLLASMLSKTSSPQSNPSAASSSPLENSTNVNHSPKNVDIAKSPELKEQILPKKPPKIFFGTRTHKQISQIIRELKKTIYKDSKMTILSSRERTCINSYVLRSDNKQEACNELIYDDNGPGCAYYRNHRKVSHYNPSSLAEAFDIEDLIKRLKYTRACPYFSARALVAESEIVFCPYNYLVDPLIRSSLDIVVKNNVIIMDEAHNLEDSAREAASLLVTHLQVIDAIGDITQVAPACEDASPSYYAVCNILSAFHGWFSNSAPLLKQSNFDVPSKVYTGEEMIAVLDSIGAGPDNYSAFEKHVGVIVKEESDIEVPKERMKLSGKTLFLLKSFLFTLSFIYRDNLKYMPDYRCILTKQRSRYPNVAVRMGNKPNSDLSVNFCCLNPAVAFSDIRGNIHTLVVASGTLSPMASFQSELGMPFKITLEANHVVSRSQMWVGTIGHGSSGAALAATYHNTETFAFQDEIGNVVLEICSIIPYGVLCFVSSYGMLDKLSSRWQMTGLWQHLETKKLIVCEPKGQSKNFDASIREFYNAVEESRNLGDLRGALLIAVCRGKVSEGLDFADDNARAVITIGIPFPSIKDTQVDLKRKYNDVNFSKKEIMSGSEWYETQAFRALNQALGRCIRHRNDFGALIIVDERFQKQPRYVSSLSKWIRKEIVHYRTAVDAFNSLREFSLRTGMSQVKAIDNCDDDVPVVMID